MSKSRVPLIVGLGAAGGIGYYLYSAGGSPKAAENKFESTSSVFLHRASILPSSVGGFSDALLQSLRFGAQKSMTYFY